MVLNVVSISSEIINPVGRDLLYSCRDYNSSVLNTFTAYNFIPLISPKYGMNFSNNC